MSKRKYLFLDVETTGLDPFLNSVVQIGAIVYADGEDGPNEIARYSATFSAHKDSEIDLQALQVNGRPMDDIRSYKDDPEIRKGIFYNFADFLITYVDKNTYIIGHNIEFDLAFLNEEADRYKLDFTNVLDDKRKVDTKQIAMFLNDAKLINTENNRLVTIYNHLFDTDLTDNDHHAMMDARMDADIYFKMRELV